MEKSAKKKLRGQNQKAKVKQKPLENSDADIPGAHLFSKFQGDGHLK